MRVPRMTTRRWMMFVLVVALLMGMIVGGVRLRQRREDLAIHAIHHAMQKAQCEPSRLTQRKCSSSVLFVFRYWGQSETGDHLIPHQLTKRAWIERKLPSQIGNTK